MDSTNASAETPAFEVSGGPGTLERLSNGTMDGGFASPFRWIQKSAWMARSPAPTPLRRIKGLVLPVLCKVREPRETTVERQLHRSDGAVALLGPIG